MAILMINGRATKAHSDDKIVLENWKSAFLKQDPGLDIRIWPNTGKPEDITFALVWHPPTGELRKYPHLKCIASLGAGVDHIMQDPQRPKDIPIVRVVDKQMAKDMTQYVVWAVLNHVKRFDHWAKLQNKTAWEQEGPFSLTETQIGVMGLGHLGQHIASALVHLGLQVSGWSRSKKIINKVQCFSSDAELELFLSQSDILICILPLTPTTRNILNEKTLAHLPEGAYVINVARGELLVEQDLMAALDRGQLSGACLDVFQTEPLPKNHPFWKHPKIRITPHIASVTNVKFVAPQIIDNYHRLSTGQPLLNRVDTLKGY